VTTSATATVGSLVLVRGKLGTDKDFGFNYKYPVLIEDAAVAASDLGVCSGGSAHAVR